MPAMTFVLDIETLGSAAVLPGVVEMAAATDRDPASFAALSPALARVVCVGLRHLESGRETALLDLSAFPADVAKPEGSEGFANEGELLERLNAILRKATGLVTFNGRGFDIPVLVHRMVANGVIPCTFLLRCARQPRYKANGPHFDVREALTFQGAAGGLGTSLRAFALGYGLEDPKAGGCGSDVAQLVERGEAAQLASYCIGDVRTTAALYERWSEHAGVA